MSGTWVGKTFYGDARDVFKVGQRVETTDHAIENGIVTRRVFGVVTSIGTSSPFWTVYVRKVGRKHPLGYHMSFWQPTKQRKPFLPLKGER